MTGEVKVLVPTLLHPFVGGVDELRLEVGESATVEEVLDAIKMEFPVFDRRLRDETGALRRYVNIYLGPDEVRRLDGLKTRVAAGSELMVVQSVAGG